MDHEVKSLTGDPVTILSVSESSGLLASVALGRLVTVVDGEPQIFPVNFVVQRNTVLFRTAEGTKLVSAAINNYVFVRGRRTRPHRGLERHRQGRGSNAKYRRRNPRSRASSTVVLDRDAQAPLRAGATDSDHRSSVPIRRGAGHGIRLLKNAAKEGT